MDGRVEIVNQLGADGGLGQDKFNGGERVNDVAIKDGEECEVLVSWRKTLFFDVRRTSRRQPGQSFNSAVQEFTYLSACLAALVARKSLCGIGQHKLVTLFHCLTTIRDLIQHFVPSVLHFLFRS